MATIKKAPKAQLGKLIKKGVKEVAEAAPKKIMSLADKVKEAKFQKNKGKFGMEGEDVTLKDFSRKELLKKLGPPADYTPKSSPVVLTDAQKANNARILKEIREGKRKNGGKVSKAQGGVRMPKQLEQKGKPDIKNLGLSIDTTSVPKGFKKLPGKSIASPDYKPSKRKYKTGGKVSKMKNGGSLTALKASNKRDNGIDPKGAFTKVQKKTLAGARGKASLTKDKQLGATKMAKRGMSIKKK